MKKTINFEAEMAELEGLLSRLNDESTSLDEAVSLYAKAADKINSCTQMLKNARLRVEQIDEKLTKDAEE